MEVEFKNLSYTVRTHFNLVGEKKTLLKNVNGKFCPGELTAILGPSGAGKTTLLHALSGYRTEGVQGDLLVDNTIRNEAWFRRISSYITQEDALVPYVSVQESMMLAAELKLPQSVGGKFKQQTVHEILSQMGLGAVQDTSVDKLSGGQQKRLSIALELIDNPPVFFLDEPISGLDDVSAKHTIQMLRFLANEGRTVVITVHQPSALLLKMFHKIYVVAAGRCVYQGSPKVLVSFLENLGYSCPLLYNPADYIIELVDNMNNNNNIDILSKAIENGIKCNSYYEESDNEILENGPNELRKKSSLINNNFDWIRMKQIPADGKINFATSSWHQFIVLLQRFFLQYMRNKKALLIQTIHYVTCGFLLGVVFYDNGDNGAMMYNHLKFCVGFVLFFSHTRLFIPIILFPSEVKIAKKEHFNRWYGLGPYFGAVMLANLPLHFFFNFIYTSLVYYLSGLPREMWRYVMYIVIGNCVSLCTEGIGLAIGSIFNPMLGTVVGPSLTAPFLGLAIYGFDFAKQISALMTLLMRMSPMRCGLAAFIIVTFGFGRKPLQCNELYCHFADPKVLIDYLDGSDNQIYTEMAALIFSIIFYRIIAYISLRKRFAT